jgi:hypothetical protein
MGASTQVMSDLSERELGLNNSTPRRFTLEPLVVAHIEESRSDANVV